MRSSSLSLSLAAFASTALAAPVIHDSSTAHIPSGLQNVLEGAAEKSLYKYPTDLTRDIIPRPIHSHNDYWRNVPFWDGLAHGAISTEADVWLVNGTLYVGHDTSSLTKERTLESLYLDPIMQVLRKQNPSTPFVPEKTRNGVFDTATTQPLHLFIDLKTSPSQTFAAVLAALQPLLAKDYLTTFNGTALRPGPITVIATGTASLNLIRTVPGSPAAPRICFFDADLASLTKPEGSDVGVGDSPVASAQFSVALGSASAGKKEGGGSAAAVFVEKTEEGLKRLREQVAEAHRRGIKARYWDLPAFPVWRRNRVWRVLSEEGVDLLNVDDLDAAVGFWE